MRSQFVVIFPRYVRDSIKMQLYGNQKTPIEHSIFPSLLFSRQTSNKMVSHRFGTIPWGITHVIKNKQGNHSKKPQACRKGGLMGSNEEFQQKEECCRK